MKNLSWLPPDLRQRLKTIVPKVYQESVFSSFSLERPTTLRTNTLKTTTEDLQKTFKMGGINVQRYRPLPDAYTLIGKTTIRQLTSLDIYQKGYFYVQSLSSMLPPLFLEPQPGQEILDMTASPGSKTTQMAAIMKDTGSITALESNQVRVYKLLANLKIQGVENTKVVRTDARFFWRDHREKYDKVLLDAPCSGEGRIRFSDPSTYTHWSVKEVKRMHFLQRSLIFSALNCLRPGGLLVYSTCTLAPEENEAVIDFALTKFAGRLEIEDPPLTLPNFCPALRSFAGVEFNRSVQKAVRIYSDEKFEGFFICRIRKLG